MLWHSQATVIPSPEDGSLAGSDVQGIIREEMHSYSIGMSKKMKHKFGFVNIAAGAFVDITDTVVVMGYKNAAAA